MQSKTKAISEGAMMLSMIALLMIVNRQFASTFELLLFILSIPVVVYTVKYGTKMGVILIVSAGLIGILFSTITSIFYLISALLMGLIYGYGVLHKWRNQGLLILCILSNLVVSILTVFILSNLFGFNIQEDINLMLELLPNVNYLNIELKQFVFIVVIISYVGMALMQAWIIHILCIAMLRRLKIVNIQVKNAFEFRISKWMVIVIVLSFILYILSIMFVFNEMINSIILMNYSCMLILSIVDGFITIACYLSINRKGRLAIIFTLIACFIPLLQLFIAVIGILDIKMQLRSKMKEGVLHEIYRKN